MRDIYPDISGLLHDTDALISVFDHEDRLRYANKAFRNSFGLNDDDFPTWADMLRNGWENNVGTVIKSDNKESWLTSAQSRRGKTPFRSFEADLLDGRWIWMTEAVGDNDWMLCIAVDITALATDNRTLRHDRDLALRASRTDELTGVPNRRHTMEQLGHLIDEKSGGCIAVLDIDHFKSINDTYGHPVGDSILADFAQATSRIVRRSDCFGRIGGEEFLLIMPDIETAGAIKLLNRIRDENRQRSALPNTLQLRYTFSAGITELRPDDNSGSAFSRADEACYRAKQAGRDRIIYE